MLRGNWVLMNKKERGGMKRVAHVQDIREWFNCEKTTYYAGGDIRWLRDEKWLGEDAAPLLQCF